MTLLKLINDKILEINNLSQSELDKMINADKSVLYDPFLYDDCDNLITYLHDIKQNQKENENEIIVIDTDYDTDGIMSACVLAAALSVFNINYRIYTPHMKDGYGLSEQAIRQILDQFGTHNKITHILTADNGVNAINAIDYANNFGIEVLVTDHHLGGEVKPNAKAIVNPNKIGDNYPFKGNAGATVAWKVMLAYATKYEPDKYDLIYDLVLFAGLANIADVMQIRDENHFIVREAVKEANRLQDLAKFDSPYNKVKNTPYAHYNAIFHGLYDLIKDYDKYRKSQKASSVLPDNEELFSWYLSPLLNANRRVYGGSDIPMKALIHPNPESRKECIYSVIKANEKKSQLRDKVLFELDNTHYMTNSNAVFVNTQHGISGLIASRLLEVTGNATIVFGYPTQSTDVIFTSHQYRYSDMIIGGSARSTDLQPLPVIMQRINEINPNIIVGGGGHSNAAGYSINIRYFDEFKLLFDKVAGEVREEILASQDLTEIEDPSILLTLTGIDGDLSLVNERDLSNTIMDIVSYYDSLRPFGNGFNKSPIKLRISKKELELFDYNPNFWKTFKANINGVELLTFNINLADKIKNNENDEFDCYIDFKLNEFRGRVTPQIVLL